MGYRYTANQHNQSSMPAFTRLLADYRARVHEHYLLAMNDPTDAIKPMILVVEDNTDQWFLTRWALSRRFPKAQIHWLTEEKKVIPYLDAYRQREKALPQMILVDLYLPSAQQGLNVLQALKSHPLYKPLPTVALSWSNDAEDMGRAFNYLADGYVVKPTSYEGWLDELSLLDRYWPDGL